MVRTFLFSVSLCVLASASGLAMANEAAKGPERLVNFRLTDQHDRSHELYRAVDAKAVVLYIHGNGCPIVRQSVPKLERIREEFEEKGVRFFMLNANPHDERAEIREEAEEFGINMPILHDAGQTIVAGLQCSRTAEVIVADPAQDWKIIYRGAVDDRFDYGAQREEAEHDWLRDALQAHLAGEPIEHAQTHVKGCLINYMIPEEISYARDVAPIIAEKCATCHASGGLGPFSMNTHRRIQGWAPMMAETIRTGRMPPWHADEAYRDFHDNRGLTAREERILLTWLDQGAEKAEDEEDPLRRPGARGEQAWGLGEPDLLLELPVKQELPAEGIVEYRYVYVESGLTENKWVRGLEVRPSNAAVVHHALIFIIYPPEYRHMQPNARSGLSGYFAAFLPGAPIKPHPEGVGQFVPAGSTFVFQMHYNTTGREESDQTQMALYFYDEQPESELQIRAAFETEFAIPPHAADHPISAEYTFRQDAVVWALSPHMHYRGSRARFAAAFPDGSSETLLNIPFYEFDWQPLYWFKEPVQMPAESKILVEGAFDNSRFNPKNPNPDQMVRFGEQSFEEMFIGYIACSVPINPERYQPREVEEGEGIEGTRLDEETLIGTRWRVFRNIDLEFQPDGKLAINEGAIRGTWSLQGTQLDVKSPFRSASFGVVGNEIFVNGRPLTRLE